MRKWVRFYRMKPNPWQSKIEARLHEESKFWRASKPFPNQSSMQGRESEKESHTEGNFATSFHPCEIFASQKKFLQAYLPLAKLKEILKHLFSLAKFSQAHLPLAKLKEILQHLFSFAKFSQAHLPLVKLKNFATPFQPWEIFATPYLTCEIFL